MILMIIVVHSPHANVIQEIPANTLAIQTTFAIFLFVLADSLFAVVVCMQLGVE